MTEKELANLKPYQKGQSGNSAGKSAGTKSRKVLIKKYLATEDEFDNPLKAPDAPLERMTLEDRIILALLAKAISGDLPSIQEVLNSAYGKIPDKMQLEQDQPATVIFYMPENNR
ncbi:MAG TPA: DUF5681 domain-containing protein [Pyrinomonadaceae bacterium]